MFVNIKCICSSCGKVQSGMRPGQPHRHCPNRTSKARSVRISPSEGGQNRSGKKLVTGRGRWEDAKEAAKA